MNYLVIILAVILVIILWYIYINFTSAPTVASNIDLSTTALTVPASQIQGGTSVTYAVGCWIFIKNMPSSPVDVINYVADNTSTSKINIFTLKLSNTNGPTLTAIIKTGSGNGTDTSIILTNNIPVQSWVYVVVSVSNNYIDSYINGKLVNSTPMSNGVYTPTFPTNTSNGPTFISPNAGNASLPIVITGLSRWNTPLDPQTVWGYYSQGNGNALQSMLGASYHLDLVFKKDADVRNWSLL